MGERNQPISLLKRAALSALGLILALGLALLLLQLFPPPDHYRNPPCWGCDRYGEEARGLARTDPGPQVKERKDPGMTTHRSETSRSDRYPELAENRNGVPVPRPSQSIHQASLAANSVLYSVEAKIDEYSRRATAAPGKREKHLLLMGCSFVFGTGVKDEETLAARLAGELPEAQPYNGGFGGYGPTSLFVRSQEAPYFDGISQKEGVALYYWINDHVMRALGSYALSKRWGAILPRVEEGPNGLETKGTHGAMGLGAFFPYFQTLSRLGLSWPIAYTDEDLLHVARILQSIGENYKKHHPKGKFLVVLAPHLHLLNETYDLRPQLDRLGIAYLDYSDREIRKFVALPYIPGEGHPSPEYYQKMAEWIAADLKKNRLP